MTIDTVARSVLFPDLVPAARVPASAGAVSGSRLPCVPGAADGVFSGALRDLVPRGAVQVRAPWAAVAALDAQRVVRA